MKKGLSIFLILISLVLGMATIAYAWTVSGSSGIYRPSSGLITMWSETRANGEAHSVFVRSRCYRNGTYLVERSNRETYATSAYIDYQVAYAPGNYEVDGYHVVQFGSNQTADSSFARQSY